MQETPTLTKERFLANLEKALRVLLCERLHADADAETRSALASDIAEFVRENAADYPLGELVETFTSYEAAIGLFYEYQDAKRLVEGTAAPRPRAAAPAPGMRRAGDRWEDPAAGIVFVWVPGGSFLMGSPDGDERGQADERPAHEVWVDGFWMASTPVTVAQYERFAEEHPHRRPAEPPPAGAGRPDAFPVTGVTWHDADAFSRWLSKRTGRLIRLPSEAQWEYAARSGGRGEAYAGGHAVEDAAWYADNSGGRLHRVARKSANGIGLYDMCGNVCEWCQDHYDRAAYARHEGHNPVVRLDADPDAEAARVVRGGSFRQGARDVRCTDRGLFVADYRSGDVGFRLIRRQG